MCLPPIGWAKDVVCRHQEAAIEERSDAPPALMRAVLGVESEDDLNERLKRASGIEGVFILSVDPQSAAAQAGLTAASRTPRGVVPGDVIVALNGKPVSRIGDLLARIDDFEVGTSVELTVLRGGVERRVPVRLEPGE